MSIEAVPVRDDPPARRAAALERSSAVSEDEALLGASIHRRLRDQVASGELRPGQSLSVPKLAAALGVSRSPVREAVQRLIHDGLAVHVPYAGARVVQLGDDEVRAVLLVRQALDGLAAREAAPRIGDADLERLRVCIAEQRAALVQPLDEARDTALDVAFHRLIREASGNAPLNVALARLEALGHLSRTRMWRVERYRELGFREHLRVFDALDAGETAAAGAAAEAHVAALLVRMSRG